VAETSTASDRRCLVVQGRQFRSQGRPHSSVVEPLSSVVEAVSSVVEAVSSVIEAVSSVVEVLSSVVEALGERLFEMRPLMSFNVQVRPPKVLSLRSSTYFLERRFAR
jgi:hypothetical protein